MTNTTNRSVRINAVALEAPSGLYDLSTPTTCVVGGVLPPNGVCTITLGANS